MRGTATTSEGRPKADSAGTIRAVCLKESDKYSSCKMNPNGSTPAASTISFPLFRVVTSTGSELVASSSELVAAGPELPADPVLAELEAALAMRRAGADPKALRRALRRIEELLDE